MAPVEQAVFTSARTARSFGYQVVATSPGVCEADARELAVWGPSHDSLLELGPDAASVNFHPLPSGAYGVSRTTAAGWEYSGRGGHRVYTQCLIVPPEVLWRFANNPFALMRAATAGGLLEVHDRVPEQLPSLQIAGKAAPVDQDLLARLAANPGPEPLATLVQAALDSVCLAVAGPPAAAELIAGLMACLPPECRPELSFSTGLKFTSRRPFRVVALSGDQAQQRWVAHHGNVTVLDLSEKLPANPVPVDGWARLIGRVSAMGRTTFLATELSKQRTGLTVADLPALGLQLLEDLDASAFRNNHLPETGVAASCDGRPEAPSCRDCPADGGASAGSDGLTHAHAAHHRFEKSSEAATATQRKAMAPSKMLDATLPEILEKLEHLDDLVYEAIGGQTAALEQLKTAWPQFHAELGDELVADSREQYLRYALSLWEECECDWAEGGHGSTPAVQALEVLCILFDEV